MPRLTDRRFQQAESILEEYRGLLHSNFKYSTRKFEMKLCECWKVGYQRLKMILIDMAKHYPRYRYLALYYMENQYGDSPVIEFHCTLTKQYGAKRYGSDEYKEKQKEFWETFKKLMSECQRTEHL